MRLFGVNIELAKKPEPKVSTIEIGTSAEGTTPSLLGNSDELYDFSKIKAADFKKMLDNDGTVQALYNTLTMPILGSNWSIEPDEDTPESRKQTEWVEESLRTPPHKGGMSTPFSLVIAQMMRAVLEGYAGFEKVLEIKDGKIVFRKIAWRDPSTLKFRTDGRGGFKGFKQSAYIDGNYADVIIPQQYAYCYTYGKEFSTLKGRSAFTAAYTSYDKKRRIAYFIEQQAQNDALKTKVVTGKENASQPELDATVDVVDELGFKATVGIPEGYKLELLEGTTNYDLMPYLDFLNAEMARSVLAMFILLGTGSKTGSYSLSQDQSDFFIQALMSIRKSLEEHITSYIISDLYDYNFANPSYGTFKFEDLTDSTIDIIKQAFIKIIEKDHLPESVMNGIIQKMADKLDIDVDILKEAADGTDDSTDTKEKEVVEETPPVSNNSTSLATGWRRELTPAEKKVNFTGIDAKANTLEAHFEREAKPIYTLIADGATAKLTKYLEDGAYDKVNEKNLIDENLRNQYIKLIKDTSLEAYIYGKNGAADEIERKAPATPKESKDFFREQSISVSDKQFADLVFQVQQEVQKGRRKDQLAKNANLSVGEIIAKVAAVFATFFSDNIGLTAAATVVTAINLGRKDTFKAHSKDIASYQFSAILDTRTCAICKDLDGRVVGEDEYKRTEFDPPIHHRCRCIWVAILLEELDQPAITGFPVTPGGVSSPSLSTKMDKKLEELAKEKVDKVVADMLSQED